jgi:hypothetical protein
MHVDPRQIMALVLGGGGGGGGTDTAQEESLASVFDSIPVFQPQSYATNAWVTENTHTGNKPTEHPNSITHSSCNQTTCHLSQQLYIGLDCYQFLIKVPENKST